MFGGAKDKTMIPRIKKTVTLQIPEAAAPAADAGPEAAGSPMDKCTQTLVAGDSAGMSGLSSPTMPSISGNSKSLSKLRKSLYASSRSKSFSSDQAAAAALQKEKIIAKKSSSFTDRPTPSRRHETTGSKGPSKMRRIFGQGMYHSFDQTLSRHPKPSQDLAPLPENGSTDQSYCCTTADASRCGGSSASQGGTGMMPCGRGQGVGDVPYDWTEYRLFRERMNRRRSTGSHSIRKFNRLKNKRHR